MLAQLLRFLLMKHLPNIVNQGASFPEIIKLVYSPSGAPASLNKFSMAMAH
jgi:hypothetical protein